jgi:hypothetical protein
MDNDTIGPDNIENENKLAPPVNIKLRRKSYRIKHTSSVNKVASLIDKDSNLNSNTSFKVQTIKINKIIDSKYLLILHIFMLKYN